MLTRQHALSQPDKPALIMADSGAAITYAELESRANRAAHALRRLGLQSGARLALMCNNGPEYIDLYWATNRSGISIVPIATRLTAGEVSAILADCEAELLIVDEPYRAVGEAIAASPDLPRLRQVAGIGGAAGGAVASWEGLLAGLPDSPIADEAPGTMMFYSSGTTGRPKGIYRPPPSPEDLAKPSPMPLSAMFGIGAETIYLCPAPLYHASPLAFSSAIMGMGGTVVMMRKFDAEGFLKAVERYRVTATLAVPTMFVRLLKLPDAVRLGYDVSSLKVIVHAAAPCPVGIKQAMIEWVGPIVDEFYGGSEGNGMAVIHSDEWLRKPGSVGRAAVGTLHICDAEGNELPAGEVGTVYFSGGANFSYYNDPERTAAGRNPLHPEMSTLGDIGHLDADGYLFLSDRRDFMIISGGVNIYPQEVENLLVEHPKVTDVAVFGVPNADFGEEVKAVVQPARWDEAGAALEAELIDWCRERLAHHKCPRTIDFEEALPRAENGKLYKNELKRRYWPK